MGLGDTVHQLSVLRRPSAVNLTDSGFTGDSIGSPRI